MTAAAEVRSRAREVLRNHPSSSFLSAVVAGKLRIAPNPPSRSRGHQVWDAGPAADWCEVAWEAISALHGVRVDSQEGATRIGRQASLHAALTGICTRPAPHWG